ncbi:MAG: hypothetical protein K2L45_11465 [Muribaculaceae bacterium]|nr:hypothetical protein [Muribaculaceae bacterium]
MKRLYTFIAIIALYIGLNPQTVSAVEVIDSLPQVIFGIDSVSGIMPLSDSDEGKSSLLNGIIPPAPQSLALARYAEYPVSHTTGIPDISIPLYEIHVGNYTLPISISYHSSGARVDDVPTCVGQGWTLNAGGAVIRTVMGAPDQPQGVSQNRKYMDVEEVRKLMAEKKGEATYGYRHIVRMLLENNKYYDTESDRYSYNVGGLTGLFRYDINKDDFVTLDHAPHMISFKSNIYAPFVDSEFVIKDAAGNEYYLGKNEVSCLSDDGNGNEYTTAWYVDSIRTPYGNVRFSYLPGDLAFNITRSSMTTEAGYYPYKNGEHGLNFGYKIEERNLSATYRHDQTLVKEITWEGNRISFTYSNSDPGFEPHRLESVTVFNADGSIRKKVTFSYTIWYESGSSGKGRPLLTSVNDSESGNFSLAYYDMDGYYGIPSWKTAKDTAGSSDLWGYYNGGNASIHFLPADIAAKLEDKVNGVSTGSRDRSPKLSYTRMGVLKSVQFPTGGNVTYSYELNSMEVDGKPYNAGGLRVSRVDINDGGTVRSKTYSYQGFLTQDPPEQRMICDMTLVWSGVDPFPSTSYATSWRTVSSYPVGYSYAPSNPVAYTFVTETCSDGSRTEYEYFPGYLADSAMARPTPHPTTWSPSLLDPGRRMPRLKRRSVYDSNGNEVFRESLEYAVGVDDDMLTTGLRLYCNVSWSDYKKGDRFYTNRDTEKVDEWFPIAGVSILPDVDDYLFYEETKARRIPTLPSRRTEEDLATGFKTVTEYSYDADYRTLQPRSQTVTNSNGTVFRTEYTYPFNHTEAYCREMTEWGLNDLPVETRIYSGQALLSKERIGYTLHNGFFYPSSISSWSAPTASSLQSPPATLPERERISSFNSKGRPLLAKINATDETSFKWNSRDDLLESSTAPGGLKTTYTHKPLFGLASVTLPNGYTTSYLYNAAGLLQSVSDKSGAIEEYTYSYTNHPKLYGDGNSVTTRRKLDASGFHEVLNKQYYSGLGLPTTLVQGGMNTKGEYLYSTTGYDNMGRPVVNILPGAGGKTPKFKSYSEIDLLAKETHGEDYARSQTIFDALERPVKVTTPGDAWNEAGKAKVTQYIANAANSVRLYRAPMTAISLVEDGYYAAKTLQGVRTVDEDGKEMTVYTDRLGRKVLERRGPESKKGQNDTYFVYNDLGQLRYVLSPAYQEDANQTEYVYEYRYDRYGNVVYKAIPGAGYTQYWYDRAGRLAYMQDANLRSKSLYRFFIYDKAGRQAIQGVCKVCTRDETVNFATYTGGTGGFMSTGYTLANSSRIQQATLETVSYYDDHTFTTYLDTDIAKSSTQSCKGLQTGSVVYNSDGTKSSSALYYDAKGQVIESKERTSFGTLRTTTNTYTYSGQPLKSMVTEGNVTTITENTYDPGSGLLTATDVTINGTKQRVSAVAYDDLGRIASVTRGAEQNSGGKVSYTYNIHGQTTSITGPGFSQNLFYADGPGNKLYNGSVSAMTWTMGPGTARRGYKYSYNDYGWLTSADYGESDALTAYRDRYSEKFTAFTRNGGITKLQRNGLKADGTYGKVDDLTLVYTGNRVSGVSDLAPAVTQNGSMDYPGGNTSKVPTYNAFGALVSDYGRGITSIDYDNFGNPTKIQYSGSRSTSNVYSSSGEKLKTVQNSGFTKLNDAAIIFDEGIYSVQADDMNIVGISAGSTVEYHGNIIYRNGTVDMILFPGGYATINGNSVTFHYYTQDYLGNNRAVINGSTGAIEQTVAYYPYGGVIADLGTAATTGQPYKFGGKELMTANGLNEYDFGARQYYSAVPGFTSIDPFCEDTQWLSPYLFCGNDPVNNTDPTGAILETVWDVGNVLYDVGEAAYNHMTGNHDKAKQNWIDAGLDIGAMLIPGIPAGASKVGKAVKAAVGKADKVTDVVSDGKKASKGMKNAERVAEGKEFGKSSAKSITDANQSTAAEVTLVPMNGKGNVKGNRTRVDILKQNDNTFHIVEFKLTDTTPLTKGQKNAWEHVKNGNGIFEVRSTIDNLNLNPGDYVKVTDYKIITKYKN